MVNGGQCMIDFVVVIFNDNYIPFLKVLLYSIYGVHDTISMVHVYHNSVRKDLIDELTEKTTAKFQEVTGSHELRDSHLKEDERMKFLPSRKIDFWHHALQEIKSDRIVFMDCDMMLLRPMDKFFDYSYDIGYTYKTEADEGLKWLLNTGILLVNNRENANRYFLKWSKRVTEILSDSQMTEKGIKGWGAADQAALGWDLEHTFSIGADITIVDKIKFRGFKCKELNETRCVPITDDLHVIHYKGSWHNVLLNKRYEGSRSKEKGEIMFNLWQDYLKKFDDGTYFE